MDQPDITACPPPSPEPQRQYPPFSKQAIWGFVIACISIFVFGFLGLVGFYLSIRGYRAAKAGAVRGKGLALAGAIIGAVAVLAYAGSMLWRNMTSG